MNTDACNNLKETTNKKTKPVNSLVFSDFPQLALERRIKK